MGTGQTTEAATAGVVIAVVRCEECPREYYSAAVPRLTRELPPCPDCRARQRVADLIVGE